MMEHITWITGMPRSGTNWLSQIFASSPAVRLKLCPLFSYEFKNCMDESSSPGEWAAFFPKVYETRGEYLDQDYLRKQGAIPAFPEKDAEPAHLVIKSTRFHNLTASMLEKHPTIRFVAIVRHPCATIHSWLTNPLEFPEGSDPAREWRSGACRKTGVGEFWGFDDWKAVTAMQLDLAQKYPDRFFLLCYEELVLDALGGTRELFGRLGIPYASQTHEFLQASQSTHSDHKRAVFKSPSVKDRWRGEMDGEMVRTILDEVRGTPLARFTEGRRS